MSDIKRIEPGPRMTQAVVHGGTVYLAGQIASPGADVATQTRDILANVDRLLAEAGSSKSRVLQAHGSHIFLDVKGVCRDGAQLASAVLVEK